MNIEDERHQLLVSLTEHDLIRTLWLEDEVRKLNNELMDMMTLICPDGLLVGMTLNDMRGLLKGELDRRTAAKGSAS